MVTIVISLIPILDPVNYQFGTELTPLAGFTKIM